MVGPLSKKAISRIARLPDRGAPVLLLNALDADAVRPAEGPPIFQFALSPEDEARAVATFARANGHSRAGPARSGYAVGNTGRRCVHRTVGSVRGGRRRPRGVPGGCGGPRATGPQTARHRHERGASRTAAPNHPALHHPRAVSAGRCGFRLPRRISARGAPAAPPDHLPSRARSSNLRNLARIRRGTRTAARPGSGRSRVQRHAVGARRRPGRRRAARAGLRPVAGRERRVHPVLRVRSRCLSDATTNVPAGRPPG